MSTQEMFLYLGEEGHIWAATADGQIAYRMGQFTVQPPQPPPPGIGEAPMDHLPYNRQDGTWVEDTKA